MDKLNSVRRHAWTAALAVIAVAAVSCGIIFRAGIADMFSEFSRYLSHSFFQRALIVGLAVSLCAALLGVCLVLKRYSMIGDGLSHVGFGALAIAMALGYVGESSAFYEIAHAISRRPIVFTTAVVMLLAFALLRLNSSSRIKGDAAIALLSTGALALGIIVVSVTDGMNIDISNYMFGSIFAVDAGDVKYALIMSAVVAVLFILSYNQIFAVTFDETFSQATGVKTGLFNMLLAALTAVTIVMGMRLMGTMLISSLVIFPALTSMRVFSRFRQVVAASAVISVVCFIMGLMLSCLYDLPAGAAVVGMNVLLFVIFHIVGKVKGVR